jgi:hypothetical protein
LVGVTKATADTDAFKTAFKASVAKLLTIDPAAVAITQISTVARRVRHLLAAGVAVEYDVTKSDATVADVTAALTSPASGTAMTTDLTTYGATSVTTSGTLDLSPTSAPTFVPAAGSSGASASACFAGTELLTLESGMHRAVSEIRVGDRVLTVNAKGQAVYSDVVYLPHGPNEKRTVFTAIGTESGRDLKMTANHVLPAGACALSSLPLVAARQIAVGDCVQTVSGREQVVSVGKVEGKGIYTIIAMEELIVVNGIVATPFGGVNPTLANAYYNLHRVAYSALSSKPLLATGRWLERAADGFWNSLTVAAARSA